MKLESTEPTKTALMTTMQPVTIISVEHQPEIGEQGRDVESQILVPWLQALRPEQIGEVRDGCATNYKSQHADLQSPGM